MLMYKCLEPAANASNITFMIIVRSYSVRRARLQHHSQAAHPYGERDPAPPAEHLPLGGEPRV